MNVFDAIEYRIEESKINLQDVLLESMFLNDPEDSNINLLRMGQAGQMYTIWSIVERSREQ